MKLITRILESAMLLLFFMGGFAQANAQQMDTLSKKHQAIVPIAVTRTSTAAAARAARARSHFRCFRVGVGSSCGGAG